jgi:hypothetical protein
MMIFDDDENEDESEIFFFAEALFRIDMKALSRALRAKDASEDVENTSSSSTK